MEIKRQQQKLWDYLENNKLITTEQNAATYVC